ncbi:uncharacterized protein PAC_12813 [Phialocephala subalpina]|uniref:Uncharacterized protein n=1 Tax=Phialocephala subalpina TaxID=576137 RepID=A0A1L7XD47_9HELO|nr:uncharacterized protein PAC_12813 [Phialocephala subalpina]
MKPDGNWINEDGLEFAPKKRKVVKLYSPCWSLDYLGNNHAVFRPDNDMRLPFASISIKERLVTSHLERNFNGEKMLWAREDWEANSEQVLAEEERIREKRRRGKKERERKGAKSSIQRRRKLKESKRAALIKIEESEAKVEDIGVEMGGDFLLGPSAADDILLLGSSATNDKETQTPIDELRKLAAEPTGIDINSAPPLTPLMLLKMKKKSQIRADILAGSNQSGMRPWRRTTGNVG